MEGSAPPHPTKSVPVLPWMRSPVNLDLVDECLLNRLPRLDPRLQEALQKMGIKILFPVQVAVWQEIIGPGAFERDICVNSPTGSGKTLAYALPIVQMLSTRRIDCLRALVVLPTRDLALQVVDETDRLLREAYQSWLPTVIQLSNSNAQALSDHTKIPCGLGSLRTIRRCGVERGFKGKTYPRLAKIILSATLTQDPSKLSQLDLHHPMLLTSGVGRYKLPEKLESYKLICESKLKPLYLLALLQDLKGEKCIVFTSSVESTHRLSVLLNFFGELSFKISEYSGLQHQSNRSKTLRAFREGAIDVLVASDAMTRGMDVEGVRNVINYDMPAYIKTYIHRAGRTARAGHTGRCFTLLRRHEVKRFKKMLQKADNNSCSVYPLPADSVECLRPTYSSALEKLKECMESKTEKSGGR